VRSTSVCFALALLLLVQPAVTLASACSTLHPISDAAVTLVDSSGKMSSIALTETNSAEHSSCHDQSEAPKSECKSFETCQNSTVCSSSCYSASVSLVYVTSIGGVLPHESSPVVVDLKFALPSSFPAGLYRPPRLS